MESGGYSFGVRCLGGCVLADANGFVRSCVWVSVSKLRDETKETASFWITEGEQRICVELAESPERVRWVGQVGMRSPLTAGAAGKVLLAFDEGLTPLSTLLRTIDPVEER